MTAYGGDLAAVHDAGFGDVARAAARRLIAELRGRRRPLVVDVGCGSGAATRALLDAGCDVLGIDPSPAFLALARKKAPAATFRRGSFATASLPACDAILAAGEVLGYATEPGTGWPAIRRFFARARSALRSGGILLFDLAGPGRVRGGHVVRVARGEGWLVIAESEEDLRHRHLERRITTFRRAGRQYRRTDEVHRLHLFRPDDVLAALRAAGFTARRLAEYPGFRPPAGWTVFLARAQGARRAPAARSNAATMGR